MRLEQAVAPVVNPVEPLLLDIPAAARTLSTTVWQIRELLWSKKIPFVKIGRRFLVRPADLRAFVDAQMAEAQ